MHSLRYFSIYIVKKFSDQTNTKYKDQLAMGKKGENACTWKIFGTPQNIAHTRYAEHTPHRRQIINKSATHKKTKW